MRHLSMLTDEALEAFAKLIYVSEVLGELPGQLQWVLVALLRKVSGGYRPIGIFPMMYRITGKLRLHFAQDWIAKHDHSWFACGAGRSPVDVVWRQSLRAEGAVSGGG
eukprot:7538584-Pyramimonas_sp.AAC.1